MNCGQQRACFFILGLILAGCAADKAILPSLEGKPRLKINQNVSVMNGTTPLTKS
ncbi:MAG: hypothetical protein ACRYGR_02575 [Janthinobacterium lividum]